MAHGKGICIGTVIEVTVVVTALLANEDEREVIDGVFTFPPVVEPVIRPLKGKCCI
jgi:hypothetical protein